MTACSIAVACAIAMLFVTIGEMGTNGFSFNSSEKTALAQSFFAVNVKELLVSDVDLMRLGASDRGHLLHDFLPGYRPLNLTRHRGTINIAWHPDSLAQGTTFSSSLIPSNSRLEYPTGTLCNHPLPHHQTASYESILVRFQKSISISASASTRLLISSFTRSSMVSAGL
jgi:hypothetical protein